LTPTATATATVPEQIQRISAQVASLVTAGVLNQGQGTALTTKLDAALAALNRGNQNAACGQLGAFSNQVEAFVRAGILSPAQGQGLIGPISSLCG
jgi:hypothetical protein